LRKRHRRQNRPLPRRLLSLGPQPRRRRREPDLRSRLAWSILTRLPPQSSIGYQVSGPRVQRRSFRIGRTTERTTSSIARSFRRTSTTRSRTRSSLGREVHRRTQVLPLHHRPPARPSDRAHTAITAPLKRRYRVAYFRLWQVLSRTVLSKEGSTFTGNPAADPLLLQRRAIDGTLYGCRRPKILKQSPSPAVVGDAPDRAVAVFTDEERAVLGDGDADRSPPDVSVADDEAG
jgi:hypothetical protein